MMFHEFIIRNHIRHDTAVEVLGGAHQIGQISAKAMLGQGSRGHILFIA